MRYLLLIVFIGFTQNVLKSQDIFYELEKSDSSNAKIEVFQPIELHMLVNKHLTINQQRDNKYYQSIQIYSGSSRTARSRAIQIQKECQEAIPEHIADVIYEAPNYKVRVGKVDSHDKAAFHRLKRRVKGKYRNAFTVTIKDKPNQKKN